MIANSPFLHDLLVLSPLLVLWAVVWRVTGWMEPPEDRPRRCAYR